MPTRKQLRETFLVFWKRLETLHTAIWLLENLFRAALLSGISAPILLLLHHVGWLQIGLVFVVSFVVLLFVRPRPSKIGEIRFLYPDRPLANGWTVAYNNNGPALPSFSAPAEPPLYGGLSIGRLEQRFAIDHSLEPLLKTAQLVKYAAWFSNDDSKIYFGVRIKPDENEARQLRYPAFIWLAIAIGNGNPERVGDDEWRVFTQPVKVANGQSWFELPLPAIVASIFSGDRLVYREVSVVRLRVCAGSLSISPIEFFDRT